MLKINKTGFGGSKWNKDDINVLKEMFEAGKSYQEIADAVNKNRIEKRNAIQGIFIHWIMLGYSTNQVMPEIIAEEIYSIAFFNEIFPPT